MEVLEATEHCALGHKERESWCAKPRWLATTQGIRKPDLFSVCHELSFQPQSHSACMFKHTLFFVKQVKQYLSEMLWVENIRWVLSRSHVVIWLPYQVEFFGVQSHRSTCTFRQLLLVTCRKGWFCSVYSANTAVIRSIQTVWEKVRAQTSSRSFYCFQRFS